MKKVVMFVVFAALAAMVFAQVADLDFGDSKRSLNVKTTFEPQEKVFGPAFIDSDGKLKSDILGYKLVFFIPNVIQEESFSRILLPETLKIQVQVALDKKKEEIINIVPVSVSSFQDTAGEYYTRVVLVAPVNYLNVYFFASAKFEYIDMSEEGENVLVLAGQIGHDPKQLIYPEKTSTKKTSTSSSSEKKFTPSSSSSGTGGMR